MHVYLNTSRGTGLLDKAVNDLDSGTIRDLDRPIPGIGLGVVVLIASMLRRSQVPSERQDAGSAAPGAGGYHGYPSSI